jgi:hypothetical protein
MTNRPRCIEDIRSSVLQEIFALPSDRQTEARQFCEAPRPVRGRHFRRDHIRWICAAVLESFGYERVDDSEHYSMTFARKFAGGSVRFLQIRWDEVTGLMDPTEDIVEIDPADAPPSTPAHLAPPRSDSSSPPDPPF